MVPKAYKPYCWVKDFGSTFSLLWTWLRLQRCWLLRHLCLVCRWHLPIFFYHLRWWLLTFNLIIARQCAPSSTRSITRLKQSMMFTFLLSRALGRRTCLESRLQWLLKYAKYAPEHTPPPPFPEDVSLFHSPPSFPARPPTHSIPAFYRAPNAHILIITDDPLA